MDLFGAKAIPRNNMNVNKKKDRIKTTKKLLPPHFPYMGKQTKSKKAQPATCKKWGKQLVELRLQYKI